MAAVGWTELEGEPAGLADGVDADRVNVEGESEGGDTRDLVGNLGDGGTILELGTAGGGAGLEGKQMSSI